MSHVIVIGENEDFKFDDDSIVSANVETTVDPIQNELSTDVLEFSVIYNDDNEELRGVTWATPIFVYDNGSLAGKFYFTSISRVGREQYKIDATSAIGLLEYETHYGGIYDAARFQDVVEDIILTNGLHSEYVKASPTLHRGLYGKQEDANNANYRRFVPSSEYFDSGKVEGRFSIYGGLLNDPAFSTLYDTETTLRVPILGQVPAIANEYRNRFMSGFYMDFTRASTEDEWPEFGALYFACGETQKISLGTPTGQIDIEYEVNNVDNKIVINGTTYTPSGNPTPIPYMNYYYYYGGGRCWGRTSGGGSVPFGSFDVVPMNIVYWKQIVHVKAWAATELTNSYPACVYEDNQGNLFVGSGNKNYVNTNSPLEYATTVDDYTITLQSTDQWHQDLVDSIEYGIGIADLEVSGWLPVLTKREALHRVLFSKGVILKKTATGGMMFTSFLKTNEDISIDLIYDSGSEEYLGHTNLIELTEHSYIYDQTVAQSVAFETTETPQRNVFFAELSEPPYYEDYQLSGFDGILAFNCNVAVVCGAGSVSGQKYVKFENIVRREIGNYADGKTVSITNSTLITALDSDSCISKLAAYYANAYIVKADIVFDGIHCGSRYKLVNAFFEDRIGYLTKMSLNFSAVSKASCKFVCNFIPPTVGTDYSNYIILTGNGTWQVPSEILESDDPQIRVVLIGGGTGGESGCAGSNGSGTSPGTGGVAGDAGEGGYVYDVVINNPSNSYNYSCGTGGSGAAICTNTSTPNQGEVGTHTYLDDGETFYSSALGSRLASGYKNPFTGDVYASKFITYLWKDENLSSIILGAIPGYGGDGAYWEMSGSSYHYEFGQGAAASKLLAPTSSASDVVSGTAGLWGSSANATGGAGGGGAICDYGETSGNGKVGGNASGTRSGNGGNGGDATYTYPKATTFNPLYYGYGGHGGGGGGGGGGAGISPYGSTGTAGSGGYGGRGGDGGDGCIVVYY